MGAKTTVPSSKFKFINISVEKRYYLIIALQVEITQRLVGLNLFKSFFGLFFFHNHFRKTFYLL